MFEILEMHRNHSKHGPHAPDTYNTIYKGHEEKGARLLRKKEVPVRTSTSPDPMF